MLEKRACTRTETHAIESSKLAPTAVQDNSVSLALVPLGFPWGSLGVPLGFPWGFLRVLFTREKARREPRQGSQPGRMFPREALQPPRSQQTPDLALRQLDWPVSAPYTARMHNKCCRSLHCPLAASSCRPIAAPVWFSQNRLWPWLGSG